MARAVQKVVSGRENFPSFLLILLVGLIIEGQILKKSEREPADCSSYTDSKSMTHKTKKLLNWTLAKLKAFALGKTIK